jgi:hypothetical protein
MWEMLKIAGVVVLGVVSMGVWLLWTFGSIRRLIRFRRVSLILFASIGFWTTVAAPSVLYYPSWVHAGYTMQAAVLSMPLWVTNAVAALHDEAALFRVSFDSPAGSFSETWACGTKDTVVLGANSNSIDLDRPFLVFLNNPDKAGYRVVPDSIGCGKLLDAVEKSLPLDPQSLIVFDVEAKKYEAVRTSTAVRNIVVEFDHNMPFSAVPDGVDISPLNSTKDMQMQMLIDRKAVPN